MRVPSIIRGDRLRHRIFFRLTRWLGAELDHVGKMLTHRTTFFGAPFGAFVQEVLRGPSSWSVGERELFAAVVSRANDCAFCLGTHGAIAESSLGTDGVDGWADGRFGVRVTAACRFVDKLTRDPDAMSAADVAAAREAGVDDTALAEAIHVAFAFNVINRIVNALDFAHPSERDRLRGAAILRRMGYRLPGFLMR